MDKTISTAISLIKTFLSHQGFQNTLDAFNLECPQTDSITTCKSLLTLTQEMLDEESQSIVNNHSLQGLSLVPVRQLEFPKSNESCSTLISCPTPIICICTFQMDAKKSLLLTSSTDKMIRLWDLESREMIHSVSLDAISLTLTLHPLRLEVLATGMDGSCHLLKLPCLEILSTFKNHSKYVVASVFSSDAQWMITGSHDKMVQLYSVDTQGMYKLQETLFFKGAIESLCLQSNHLSPLTQTLVVSVRGDHQLYTISIGNASSTQVTAQVLSHNMNSNGDDWVSFTALHISCSPCGTYLLVITDTPSGRIIVYEMSTWKKVQDVWGNLKIDRFSNPRGMWITNHHYIIADDEGYVTCMSVTCPQRIGYLSLHDGPIRSLSKLNNTIFTGSFDKNVKSYELEILDR